MNILFICSRNKWRSATAESIFKKSRNHNVKSAGTAPSAINKISVKLITWSDLIFVMEKKHKQILQRKFPNEILEKKIIILGIDDNYEFMDADLIEILQESVKSYVFDI